ncbi:RNA 2'-phosphotransferase [Caulobacter sp. KR2-114]|uniref:RNA 2'-phosphotransferase n=1 Tax=Caulobacter sp. KR2-114 TaxID=3400912 RepID=UPI003C12A9B6
MKQLTDETISKTLSYWLRHRPEEAGLTLDAQGWAPTDAVMAELARRFGIDFDRLLAVVETNDKQRYEFSADLDRIRARQGHSVEVSLDLPPQPPPAVLYHGTVERFLDAILAEGLKPMRRHHVHLSADVETATRVGARRGKPVILAVDAAAMAAEGAVFHRTDNGVWLTDAVAPTHLSRA